MTVAGVGGDMPVPPWRAASGLTGATARRTPFSQSSRHFATLDSLY